MRELKYLEILYTIRENNNWISLKELIHKAKLDIMYSHHSFDNLLLILYNNQYIVFMDSAQNDLSYSLNQADDIFNFFLSNCDNIYIKLTNKLFEVQSLLGFSLKDTIIKFSHSFSAMIVPFWNKPDIQLQTDVFVIMPFKNEFDFIYKNQIKKICELNNLTCKRADDIYSSKPIMQDIWSLIYYSKIIIADCSNKNPNVMYELGIAHTLGKKVILITQNIDDIPFDLRHLRHLYYEYVPHSISTFEDELNLAIQSSLSDKLDDVF